VGLRADLDDMLKYWNDFNYSEAVLIPLGSSNSLGKKEVFQNSIRT
jgi:hypothetical protein